MLPARGGATGDGLLKRRMNADFRKEKQIDDKELQSFNLRSFVLIRVSIREILLCGTLCYSVVSFAHSDQIRAILLSPRLPLSHF